jgi:mono/diheme cytochrome c family protein
MKPAFPSLALAAFLLGACHGKWPADMSDQPAVQPLEGPRPAPEGSLPVGGVETLEDREDAADLQNPFAHDPGALLRGARLFGTHCAVCHGPEGRGGGKISTKFPPAPDLRYQTICRRTDGFIYGTITAGGKAMPSMREGLTSRDRWALVTHVRHLQEEGCVAALPTVPGAPAPTEGGP